MLTSLKVSWNLHRLKLDYAENREKRLAAARDLGNLAQPKAVHYLIDALRRNDDKIVHEAIIEALVKIGDQRAVPGLMAALGDPVGATRMAAAKALSQLGQDQWVNIINGSTSDYAKLAASADPRVVDALIRPLNFSSVDRWTKMAAVEALGTMKDKRAVPVLINALVIARAEHNSDVVEKAIHSLGKLKDAAAIDPLRRIIDAEITLLRYPNSSDEKYSIGGAAKDAAYALAEIGQPEALPALLHLYRAAERHQYNGSPDQNIYLMASTKAIIRLAQIVNERKPTSRSINIHKSFYFGHNDYSEGYDIREVDETVPWPFTDPPPF